MENKLYNKLYNKIDTLFTFDQETRQFLYGEFRNPLVKELENNIWIFTEKIDGTNFRIIWDGYNLSFGGRTNKSTFNKQQLDYINNTLLKDKEILFEQLFGDTPVIIYGELYGAGIQKGDLYGPLNFKVFDVLINDYYLTYEDAFNIADSLGYEHVPIVLVGTLWEGIKTVETRDKSFFSDAVLEGLVGQPRGYFKDRRGKRIIVKIKKRDLEVK